MPVGVLVPLGLGPSLPLSLPQQEFPNLNHVARGLGLGETQQEFPNLNHVARGLGLGETPLEGVGRTLR